MCLLVQPLLLVMEWLLLTLVQHLHRKYSNNKNNKTKQQTCAC
jgi:hypothetical protein